ncbi:MAG TPA: hypothetical protein VN614_08850 [Rhodanobacter sp.]|jgi:hypothetical protein|nr:hypothetical protein [Rhodanobacter sp.]
MVPQRQLLDPELHVEKVRNDEQVAKLQASILRYLVDHPHAADTVRGIARYWTGAVEGQPPVEAVQRALDALLAQGRIACSILADGSQVYESVQAN